MIRADGIELATEALGDPAHPPVLLIMSVMASMLWWPDEFCERLANRGRRVVRYDNRDTGRSTTYEAGKPAYTLDDMADDAVRVLDGYGFSAAHLVGMSLGGMIAQLAALKHPARVASLTAIGASPVGEDTSGLPSVSLRSSHRSSSIPTAGRRRDQPAASFNKAAISQWRIRVGSFITTTRSSTGLSSFYRAANPRRRMASQPLQISSRRTCFNGAAIPR